MRLDEVCTHIVDCEHKSAPITPGGGYYAVGTPAMAGNRIVLSEAREITRETFELWTRRLVPQQGDLLFAREAPVGPIVRLPNTANIAPGQRTVLIRPNSQFVDSRFLYYVMAAPSTQRRIQDLSLGSTVAHLNVADVRALEFKLPPLAEQQAIAEVLGALDDKIAANFKLVTLATELGQALTRKAIEGGRLEPLSSLAKITMGSSPKGTSYNETGGGIVLYQGMRDFGTRFPTPRIWTTEPVRLAAANDVLISVRAPVGTLNRTPESCCIGRGLAALSTDYHAALYHLLIAQQEIFSPYNSDGTIFGSISKPQLANLPVRVPRDDLSRLDALLAPFEEAVGSAIHESQNLVALRDTLLPALMDGTLRVKDAISQAEEVL